MILMLPLFMLCEIVFSNINKLSYLSDCCPKIFYVNTFFMIFMNIIVIILSSLMNRALLYTMSY
jgi:hypothetical protein